MSLLNVVVHPLHCAAETIGRHRNGLFSMFLVGVLAFLSCKILLATTDLGKTEIIIKKSDTPIHHQILGSKYKSSRYFGPKESKSKVITSVDNEIK